MENKPKSSGAYSRARIGAIAKLNDWARAPPVARVSASRTKRSARMPVLGRSAGLFATAGLIQFHLNQRTVHRPAARSPEFERQPLHLHAADPRHADQKSTVVVHPVSVIPIRTRTVPGALEQVPLAQHEG